MATDGKTEVATLKKVTPTLMQKIAFSKLSEVIRKKGKRKHITIGKVLRSAGYSLEVSKSPQRVTKSKGWLFLMDQHYPDEKMAKTIGGALDANEIKHYVFPAKYSDKEIHELVESFGFKVQMIKKQHTWKRAYYSVPDHIVRMIAVKEAHKVKGKYPEGEGDQPTKIQVLVVNYGSKK